MLSSNVFQKQACQPLAVQQSPEAFDIQNIDPSKKASARSGRGFFMDRPVAGFQKRQLSERGLSHAADLTGRRLKRQKH